MDVHVARTMELLGARASVAAGERLRALGPCAIWEAAASWNVFDEAFSFAKSVTKNGELIPWFLSFRTWWYPYRLEN